MTNSNRNCLICDSKESEAVLEYNSPDSYEFSMGIDAKNYFREWVRCTSCNFHYSVYSRDSALFDKIYEEKYRSATSSWRGKSVEEVFDKIVNLPEEESETKQRVNWIKNTINKAVEEEVITLHDSPRNFLDIGGGSGIFAYKFQDKDWIPHLIDPSLDETFAKNRLKMQFVKDYYAPRKFKENFDLISLIYVLEHLTKPLELMKSLHTDMNDDSLLYVEVPDALAFRRKLPEDDIFNSTHLWMFDPKSLVTFLDKAGFEPISLSRVKTKRENYALMSLSTRK